MGWADELPGPGSRLLRSAPCELMRAAATPISSCQAPSQPPSPQRKARGSCIRMWKSSLVYDRVRCPRGSLPSLTLTSTIIMSAGLGVPVKLLHESLGHVITVELKTGQLYRGKLAEGSCALLPLRFVVAETIFLRFSSPAEDNLNISLKDITVTGRDGRVTQLDQVYIRGSMVRFFIVPDMLQNAPM